MTEDGGRKTTSGETSSHASHPSDGKNQNVTLACSAFLTQILNELVFVDPGRGQSCGGGGAVFGLDN